MNKTLITLSFLISLICMSSQSWGLPPCPSTGIKDNCHGTLTSKKGGKYEGEFKNGIKEGKWVEYLYNGKIRNEGIYLNGIKEGFWIERYREDNIATIETNYKNGKKISD